MAHWLLQVNEPKFAAADLSYAEEGAWNVVHSLEALALQDDVCVWVSGRDAGVFLVGTITAEVFEAERPRDYGDPDGAKTTGSFVPVRYSHRLMSEHLIPRELLQADPRFATSRIMRMPGGANPFPLTDDEWQAVVDHLPDEARLDAPPSLFNVRLIVDASSEAADGAAEEFWQRVRTAGASGLAAEVFRESHDEPELVWPGDEEPEAGETMVVLQAEREGSRAMEALRMTWSDVEETPEDARGEWGLVVITASGVITPIAASTA